MAISKAQKIDANSRADRFNLVIVEDDPHCQAFFKLIFEQAGFRCQMAGSLQEAWAVLKSCVPDLIILDESLPDGSGLDLCRKIRQEPQLCRVLLAFLTARKNVFNGSDWSKAGGDACWAKTHNHARLTASAHALLRRREWDTKTLESRIPGLLIDFKRNLVSYNQTISKNISRREMRLFEIIIDAYPNPCSRETIKKSLFRYNEEKSADLALNQLMCRLKNKLPANLSPFLQTIHGMGYCMSFKTSVAEQSPA